MAKKEVPKTFRIDEDFDQWVSKVCTDLDLNLSDLVRTALVLAVPFIKECPTIVRRITLDDLKSQSD